MNKVKILLAVLLTSTAITAQNLVANGGFEQISSPPTGYNQLNKAVGWSNCNGNYNTQGTWGSPDLLSTIGSGVALLPCGYVTCVLPHSGSNVVGFISYNGYIANCREYVSTPLIAPLQVGKLYSVSFWATTGTNPSADYVTNNIGALFTMNSFWYNTPCHTVNRTPHVNITSVLDTIGWKYFSFVFQADSAYNYITFGSFANDANTTLVQKKSSGMPYAYNVIDDIDVHQISETAPIANFGTSSNTVCVGSSFVANDMSSGNPTAWNWNVSGPVASTASVQNPTFVFSQTGLYTISLVCSNGAGQSSVVSKTVSVVSCKTPVIETVPETNELLVFPNPTPGSFIVKTKYDDTLVLFNQVGEVVYLFELNLKNNYTVSFEHLPTGIYYLKGNKVKKKIIVE